MRLNIRFLAALSLTAGIVGAAHAQDANNLLQDGYFLNGSGTTDADWSYVGPNGDAFNTTYHANTFSGGDTGAYGNFLNFQTDSGFDGTSGPGLETSLFTTTPGQNLTVSFDIKVITGSVNIGVLEGSAIQGMTVNDPIGPPWEHYSFNVTGGASEFIFENATSGGLTMQLANVDITPTPSGSPEPFTMGIGVAGICFAVRRRVKSKSAK